ELLSDVALTKKARYEEVRKKSLRDFHKTHPSGSGTATKPTISTSIIKLSIKNEGTGVKPGVPDVIEEESSESETNDQEKANDDNKTQSDNENESGSEHKTNESGSESDQEKEEAKIEDEEEEEEEEEEIVKTPSNDSDDEDEIKVADKAEGNENSKILQVIKDAHVTLSTVPQKTKVLVTSSSHSSDLAAKFLNFADIPH
nr:hypothetical protein [Tanacetum cinerariifolium]